MIKYYFLLISLGISFSNYAQSEVRYGSNSKFQYGLSCKLNIEIQSHTFSPNFKLSLSTGAGYNIEDINFYPTVHAGVILFNRGVIGSSLSDGKYKIRNHFFFSSIGTIKLDKRNYNFTDRYVPLYHFSDFTANPLQNPYKSSFSLGAIWVKMNKPISDSQRLGFFNLNIAGRAQISYYNDGGPVLRIAGDKRDRYYTGGIVLSYHGNEKAAIDLIEVSYHKFTGYVRHAFDIADKLQMDFLVYKDKEQFTYNHQGWKINISDLSSGFSINTSIYDVNSLDVQDFLHFNTNVPYHPDYLKRWRFALGGKYEYNYLRL